MKFIFCSFLLLAAVVTNANTFNLIGHWSAGQVEEVNSDGNFKVNEAEFSVSDKKIGRFINCANKKFPNEELFIVGVEDSLGKTVATAAYLCMGEISTSRCEDTDKKWFCH